ncbi:MAG: MlaD family protein [Thermoleophilaceae bacterium]
MRRLLSTLGIAVAAAAGLVVSGAGGSGSGETYRVAAIFDNAAHLIPGQDVKVAGARVGSVTDIELTDERHARIEMEIETGFAPFRSDASCTIKPQSLIGEKYIQCEPGTPDARPLRADAGGTPVVGLDQTSSPVDLDLVFAALRRPYSERLALVVNELGTGLAGRPRELSEAIRRANPALEEANELLELLNGDRRTLARLVDRSDAVLAELAAKERETASFIERADSAATAAAGRRDHLDEAVRTLPRMLEELEPAATSLARLARDGTPVVRDLRAAAPAAHDLVGDFDPLADAARPALAALADTSRTGRRAVRAATPVANRLRPLAEKLTPLVDITTQLLVNLRETGTVEGLQTFPFYAASAISRFDQVSHVLPSYQVASTCQGHAAEPVEGCDAHFEPGRERGAQHSISQREARSRMSDTQARLLGFLLEP